MLRLSVGLVKGRQHTSSARTDCTPSDGRMVRPRPARVKAMAEDM